MRIKTKFVIGFVVLLAVGCLYYLWYLGGKSEAYDDIPDLSSEYNVDDEIIQAQNLLNTDIEPATVYTKDPTKKAIAITFDGLPDPTTAARLVDLIKKYDVKVTFFLEGSNCAVDQDSVIRLLNQNITLGNYTYTGLVNLEKVPQESAMEQLLKTQKVMEVLTGDKPTIFKAPNTSYVVPLLKIAAACDLKSAVKTDVYVNKDAVKNDEEAVKFINSVPQGSIVSLTVNTPVNTIVYQAGKTDERPAMDKQPNLKIREMPSTEHQDIVEVTERLFKAIKARGLETLPVTEMREIERADILQQAQPATPNNNNAQPNTNTQNNNNGNVAMIIDSIGQKIDELLFNKAMAAPVNYDELRAKNNHQLAQSPKMINTTEPSVAFAFAGLTKPEVVYKTLDFLKKNNAKGTFFVMENELRANPQMVKDIIDSGNEVAIGMRSLKNADFYTACRQITNVQSGLANMGVNTNLVMQPWGQITDDTREAVSAMGCQMFSPTLNLISSEHKNYTSADAVMSERLGKFVYSMGRGWIVYFRLDYCDDDNLVVNVMSLLKRHKIDNIAYNSFYDDPKINPQNDSAYAIKSLGEILQNKQALYEINQDKVYPTDGRAYLKRQDISFNQFMFQRYIGNYAIEDDNMFGFSVEEKRYRDLTGLIHTNKPVVFFTFDDYGNDSAINHLLYVLRKHNAKATFFILTKNMMKNPNIARAIALEGHDIGTHSEEHHPMDNTDYDIAYNRYLVDYGMADAKLRDVVGDIIGPDGTSAYKPYFRPPTLTASKAGFKALYDTGHQYIVSGSYSTHDYEQPNLESMVNAIKEGIYDKNGKVKNGAILVMHMSDQSIYTATALDLLMTINDKRADDDPAKFIPLPLSAYLAHHYDQSNYDKKQHNDISNKKIEILNYKDDNLLYQNGGY